MRIACGVCFFFILCSGTFRRASYLSYTICAGRGLCTLPVCWTSPIDFLWRGLPHSQNLCSGPCGYTILCFSLSSCLSRLCFLILGVLKPTYHLFGFLLPPFSIFNLSSFSFLRVSRKFSWIPEIPIHWRWWVSLSVTVVFVLCHVQVD